VIPVPILITFSQTVNGKEYPTIPYYSSTSCHKHFFAWSLEGKSAIEKDIQSGKTRRCPDCKEKFGTFEQDAIMNRVMTSLYNPRRSPIYYYPVANRFKLVDTKTGAISYENFYHFRDTLFVLGQGIQRIPNNHGMKE
jgi:hypothetical protein